MVEAVEAGVQECPGTHLSSASAVELVQTVVLLSLKTSHPPVVEGVATGEGGPVEPSPPDGSQLRQVLGEAGASPSLPLRQRQNSDFERSDCLVLQ